MSNSPCCQDHNGQINKQTNKQTNVLKIRECSEIPSRIDFQTGYMIIFSEFLPANGQQIQILLFCLHFFSYISILYTHRVKKTVKNQRLGLFLLFFGGFPHQIKSILEEEAVRWMGKRKHATCKIWFVPSTTTWLRMLLFPSCWMLLAVNHLTLDKRALLLWELTLLLCQKPC